MNYIPYGCGLKLLCSLHEKFNYDVIIALVKALGKNRINAQITAIPHDFILSKQLLVKIVKHSPFKKLIH